MASLSTCHLGVWLGWQILLNEYMAMFNQMYNRCSRRTLVDSGMSKSRRHRCCSVSLLQSESLGNPLLYKESVYVGHVVISVLFLHRHFCFMSAIQNSLA